MLLGFKVRLGKVGMVLVGTAAWVVGVGKCWSLVSILAAAALPPHYMPELHSLRFSAVKWA